MLSFQHLPRYLCRLVCRSPRRGALRAVRHAVRYCSSTRTACLFQPYGQDAEWSFFSDSDHAGNAELQNKRRSQLGYIALRGRCPIAFGSKASGVTFGVPVSDVPVCHPAVTELHADVSSAAAEIYAASVALSEMCYLSYISDEMGMAIGLPFVLQVDNSTCLAFSKDQVQRSKLRHIDCRQEWVLALRDANVVRLEWVESASNFADLFTKILEADTFLRLRDQLMVFRPIPTAASACVADETTARAREVRFDLQKNEFFVARAKLLNLPR